ncbi:MAG TPA: DUF4917 family protein, partial [Lentzea sp.]
MQTFDEAMQWLETEKYTHLLLGNGFSMAFDAQRFGYDALASRAQATEGLSDDVAQVMRNTGTTDFEALMRSFLASSEILRALNGDIDPSLIDRLDRASGELREVLAKSIAGLHPDRPYDISDGQYLSTRRFLDRFRHIYTVNYDLLLYWSLMKDLGPEFPSKGKDDGFRDSGVEADDTVLWNMFTPHTQSVHYLHGALHLFLGVDGLHKITWIRTGDPLIDQARRQLRANRFPLYVAEGSSTEKLDKINRSAYLSKALRSLTGIGCSLAIYGHSLDDNDDHILRAIVKSSVCKVAISIYGDEKSEANAT